MQSRKLVPLTLLAITVLWASHSGFAQSETSDRGMRVQSTKQQISELPTAGKRWALIIGVDEYKDKQIGTLNGAANDAKALADALVRFAGFPPDQVILLTTKGPEERQPTRVNILRRLTNLAAVVPKDGLLLISFSGHGMERSRRAYLLPADAQISDDITFLEDTAIALTRMKERIRATGVRQVILMLDACRNDPGGRADAANRMTEAYRFNFDLRNREIDAFATLYATAVGQRAYEYAEKRQGYFTWAITEALGGAAANKKGEVTLAALISYVQEAVPKRVGIDLGSGKQQRPFAEIDGFKAEELVVAIATPRVTPDQTAAEDPVAVELSFWETVKGSNNPDDFKAYLQQYPNGRFATLARIRAAQGAKTSESKGPVTAVGEWVGEWQNNVATLYTCEVRLTDSSAGLSGAIKWTLKKSPRSDLQSKIGLSAVEYVKGTYDPTSRVVILEGYREDDPNTIIGMDTYKLFLSTDGQTLSGQSYYGGTWEGNFSATRKK